jgi:hypothetical protein
VTSNDLQEYARGWRWDEDGQHFECTFTRLTRGRTEYGLRPILNGVVNGEERALWLNETALRSKFRDELEGRSERRFTSGERIVVERGGEKKRNAADTFSYWPFTVSFPDRPQTAEVELLNLGDVPEVAPAEPRDDDIPFMP